MKNNGAPPIGLYVHIPFCLQKCLYCDFVSFTDVSAPRRASYIASLCEEIRSYRRADTVALDTVFFGGGTPSCLTEAEASQIFGAIRETFALCAGAEITFEANPNTLSPEKLAHFRALGFNRVSLGLQSADDGELRTLGRIHNRDDFLAAYRMVRDAGFSRVNVDLIYGIPKQTAESFARTLDTVVALAPEHICCYALILEEETPFFRMRDRLAFPDEDEECEMYETAVRVLGQNGYRHYEISNYAKSGEECRHNLHYWRDEEYIGVGIAAHSYFEGVRWGNTEKFSEYSDRFGIEYRTREDSRGAADETEYAMLRLRLSEGLSLSEYRERFGVSFAEGKKDRLRFYRDRGYLAIKGDRLFLTDRGFYVSNAILTDLL